MICLSTGGCQCGAVRYRVSEPLFDHHVCHCRMCQKAVGGAFAVIAVASKQAVTWTRGRPSRFRSSANVDRGFCNQCGTPLFYDDESSDRIGLLVGSLDQPADAAPARQDGIESRLTWVRELASLAEKQPTGQNGDSDWAAAIHASARQHPDHDTEDWPPGSL